MWDAVHGVSNLNHDFTISLRLSHTPNFPKIHPPSEAFQCKGAPTCPSTAYQDAKTHILCI